MKKGNGNIKLLGGLLAGMLIGGATIVCANQTIQAIQNTGIKISLNGQIQEFKDETTGETQYPITYNNRTYLPLRNVANLAGYNVSYDNESNMASLDKSYYSMINEIIKKQNGTTTFNSIRAFYVDNEGPYYFLRHYEGCGVFDREGNPIECLREGYHSGPTELYILEDGTIYYYVDEDIGDNIIEFVKYYLKHDENGQLRSYKDTSYNPKFNQVTYAIKKGSFLGNVRIENNNDDYTMKADLFGKTKFEENAVELAIANMKIDKQTKANVTSVDGNKITFYLNKPSDTNEFHNMQEEYLNKEFEKYYYVENFVDNGEKDYYYLTKKAGDTVYYLKMVRIAGQDGVEDVNVLLKKDAVTLKLEIDDNIHLVTWFGPGSAGTYERIIPWVEYQYGSKQYSDVNSFDITNSRLTIENNEIYLTEYTEFENILE